MDSLLPKPENSLLKPENKVPAYLNDRGLRMVLIPLFAIAVPNLTGLVNYHFNWWTLIFHYCYYLFISITIYYGNRYLLFQLSDRFNWFYTPFRKVLTLLAGVILYTLPVTLFLVGLYYVCILQQTIDEVVLRNVSLMNVICVIFVAHIYETVFLIKHTEGEMLRIAQVEKAKAEAELEALKAQIDPHFIFNSLNTLSHLITQNPEKATKFNDNLADVYRYILQHKNKSLVFLRDEMYFMENYYALLHIRFGESLQLQNEVHPSQLEHYLLPPISLQIVLENCVKHNAFSEVNPMPIRIFVEENMLVVRNRLMPKKTVKQNTGTGLINLKGRYRLLAENEIVINQNDDHFEVRLPLLSTGI